eukprot:13924993-Alexandrium_andersonii.AAC.1
MAKLGSHPSAPQRRACLACGCACLAPLAGIPGSSARHGGGTCRCEPDCRNRSRHAVIGAACGRLGALWPRCCPRPCRKRARRARGAF